MLRQTSRPSTRQASTALPPSCGATTIRAGIAALDGRTGEAIALFRVAREGWRDIGLPWEEALVGIDMATLLDAREPEVVAAAARSREILTGLRARPFLDRLEAALARARARGRGRSVSRDGGGRPDGGLIAGDPRSPMPLIDSADSLLIVIDAQPGFARHDRCDRPRRRPLARGRGLARRRGGRARECRSW